MKKSTKPTAGTVSGKEKEGQTDAKEPFEMRPYFKKELARLYFPEYTEAYALKKLRQWINENPELYREYSDGPERLHDQSFSRRQVKVIVKYLKEP